MCFPAYLVSSTLSSQKFFLSSPSNQLLAGPTEEGWVIHGLGFVSEHNLHTMTPVPDPLGVVSENRYHYGHELSTIQYNTYKVIYFTVFVWFDPCGSSLEGMH
jgi:hypothetical protein